MKIKLLCTCVLCFPFSATAAFLALPANEYYQKLGPNPSFDEVSVFFEIYSDSFQSCDSPQTFYAAEKNLARLNPNKARSVSRYKHLSECPKISTALKTKLAEDLAALSVTSPVQAPPEPLVPESITAALSPTDVQAPAIGATIPTPPTLESSVSAKSIGSRRKNPAIKTAPVLTVAPTPTADEKMSEPTHKSTPSSFSFQERYRYKKGDKGLGRLSTLQQTAEASASNWRVGVVQQTFFNGHVPADLQYGSFYRYQQTGQVLHRQKSTYNTAYPFVQYTQDDIQLYLATTPMTDQTGISPMPTARVSYAPQKGFNVSAFHESIEDSVLSSIGLRDGYSNASFGRVTRSGLKTGYTFTLPNDYFADTSVLFALYDGKNTAHNHQLKWDGTFGKYYKGFSFGLYGFIEEYQQNQNNFTFGHGGYYSPQLAFLITPFVSYEHQTRCHYFKGDIAVGYYQDRLDRVKMYLKNTGDISASVQNQYYDSASHKNASGNIGFMYEYTLPASFVIGTENRVLQSSSDYREFIGRAYIKKTF